MTLSILFMAIKPQLMSFLQGEETTKPHILKKMETQVLEK